MTVSNLVKLGRGRRSAPPGFGAVLGDVLVAALT